MTRRRNTWLAAATSAAAFVAAFFLRMNAEYGPFQLSFHPGDWPSDLPTDWMVVWELWRHGQIAGRIVVQSTVLGAAAAAVPWLVFGLATRRRETR